MFSVLYLCLLLSLNIRFLIQSKIIQSEYNLSQFLFQWAWKTLITSFIATALQELESTMLFQDMLSKHLMILVAFYGS